MADLRWICNTLAFYLNKKGTNFIFWGQWLTNKPFIDQIKIYIAKKSKTNILYSYEAKNQFVKKGVPEENLIVANNTINIGSRVKSYKSKNKNRILFVGSLNKRKKLEILIKVFQTILPKIPKNIILTIIGDGNQKKHLQELSSNYSIKDNVEFLGVINSPAKLQAFYKQAISSVSYGQAGLSVLQALGFGVPFITKFDAISGGEIYNIKNNSNGFLVKNQKELSSRLLSLINNPSLQVTMGKNAYDYYSKNCQIESMVNSFKKAIECAF